LLNYLSEKHKNYNTMSDFDVVTEALKKNNPTWTDEEVDLEMRYKYGEGLKRMDLTEIDRDIDPDIYADAVKHNKDVERNEIALKRDARDARLVLDQGKKEIKLPKTEIQEQKAEAPNQPTAEQLEQGRKDWEAMVDKEIPNLKDFSFKVGDAETGYEDISYKITDTQRKEQVEFLKALDSNNLLARLGWMDKDGKQNVSKMAGDVLKLEGLSKIISSAYTQGKTAGINGTVAEIKHIDLSKTSKSSVEATPADIGMAAWGHI